MCRTTANSPCLSLDKYTTGCQSAPCSWKSETFIPFYGYTNSHWQLAKLLNLNRKVFSIHSKYAVQPVIIVARKPIYSEVWSRARMRVSLMSQRKYDSGVTKGTSSSSMLVRPEPSLKKSNISKMQILLSLSLLFSTVTGAFSSASSVYPQSVFWPASLPLSLWSDLLDKNGKKNELPQCFRNPWLTDGNIWFGGIHTGSQRYGETWPLECSNDNLSHSFFFYPFIPLTSLHPASSSWHGRRAERRILSPTSHHLFLILFTLCLLFFSTIPLLSCSFLPSPHCFCIFNRSTISYIIRLPPPSPFSLCPFFTCCLQ